tara:strand:- start:1604 stop:1930 length:327 start_codon:yes stop_codon:yes gene_type:complete
MQSSVSTVNSCPPYISKFINLNLERLNNIYNEGMEIKKKNNPMIKDGILLFNCSEKDNVMNIQFADDAHMKTIIAQESLLSLKNNIPTSKKLLFILDLDINSVFLIHI